MRNHRLLEQRIRHREYGESYDEEADTAIGEHGTGQHHRHDRTLFRPARAVMARAMESAAPLSSMSLPKHAAQQEERKEIPDEARLCPA